MRILKIFGYITWVLSLLVTLSLIIAILSYIILGIVLMLFSGVGTGLLIVNFLGDLSIGYVIGVNIIVFIVHGLLTDYIIHKKLKTPSLKYFKYRFNYPGSIRKIK